MKKMLVFTIAMLSITAHAKPFKCLGLDNQDLVSVEINDEVKVIGTLNGAKVQLADSNGFTSLAIVQGKLITAVVAKSGGITFHQNDGKSIYSVSCIEAQ
ncbi:hypothetical protein [Bdellovibrio sp. HCB274]|uniref:hypothetical protein n=1 Tax=Bdellovibrio sp. HCB274 TaxID=3394361 RepID=UPI0039B49660